MFRRDHNKSWNQDVTRDVEEVSVQYVYHRKSPYFVGNWVVPLNKMPTLADFETTYKDIYELEICKYSGREEVMQRTIPPLGNCKWNDVNFLSPIHPHYIYDELQKIGVPTDQVSSNHFFRIPITKLNLDPTVTTMWSYPLPSGMQLPPDSFSRIDPDTYKELDALPEATTRYYRDEFFKRKKRPLLFMAVPHILTTEPIDVTKDVSIIDWRNPRL